MTWDLNLKHLALMIVLMGLMFFRPLMPSAVADAVLLPTIIFSAWLAGGKTRRALIITVLAGAAAMVFLAFDLMAHQQLRELVRKPVGLFVACAIIMLLVYCAGVILRSLLGAERVFVNEIVGTFNIYLIMGYAWSYVYVLVELCAPGSFQPGGAEGSLSLRFIYFSFITLTTVGFGDTVPVSPFAQTLVIFEAMIGQFYAAVVVAYLVGMYITTAITSAERKDR